MGLDPDVNAGGRRGTTLPEHESDGASQGDPSETALPLASDGASQRDLSAAALRAQTGTEPVVAAA